MRVKTRLYRTPDVRWDQLWAITFMNDEYAAAFVTANKVYLEEDAAEYDCL